MYNDADVKPWTSRKWAPPGFNDRKDLRAIMEDKSDGQQTLVEHSSRDASPMGEKKKAKATGQHAEV
jgi:hypothetical protein